MSCIPEKVLDMGCEAAAKCLKDKFDYIWNYTTYVENLEGGRKLIENASEGVNHEVEEARDNGEDIENETEEWLKQVERAIDEARRVQEKKKQKSCCFRGFVIDPYARYKIGKKAQEITQSIQQLETRRSGFRRIHYRTAPGKVTGSYKGTSYYATASRDAMLKQINRALMDSHVQVVGVYGPPGVGKSILLTQVVEQVHKRSLNYDFERVAMATVSRDPDMEMIQEELAYSLGLNFDNEIGVKQKAIRLRERLRKENKIVIILDDIWKKLELATLGIPNDNRGIKLLLTSRKEEILRNGMDCPYNFQLKALFQQEGIELFNRIVGRQIEDESLLELVGKAVEECGCLPVYIVPLATKLKTSAPSSWKDDLRKVRKSNQVKMNKLMQEALKDEESKKLILLCGQIGNQIIPIEDLLIYGMGLGLFHDVKNIEEGRERLIMLLENLKSFCFLEDYEEDHIKIHDVMSNASLSIASETHHSLVLRDGKRIGEGLKSRDALKNYKSISLPFVDEIIGEPPNVLECPELNMFLTYTDQNCQIQFPDSFFEKTKKLQVLDLFDVPFTSLPSSIQHLEGLHTLCLDRCKIRDLKTIGKLKKLQALTLRGSDIERLPKEVGELTGLRLLDLSRCYDLTVIERDALGGLVNLEELHFPENYEDWEAKGYEKASLHELCGMLNLTSLSICIPDLIGLPHDFPFANLKRFKIVIKRWFNIVPYFGSKKSGEKINPRSIGEASQQSDVKTNKDYLIEYDNKRTLRLKMDVYDRKIFLENWVQTALQNAQKLEVLGWKGYEKSITELSKRGFSGLKHVIVKNSPGIQHVFRPKDRFSSALLESLHLKRLKNLEKLYDGNLLTSSFVNLKILRIKFCHKLQNLFSPSLAKGLSRIEEIEVSNCNNLSEIVTVAGVSPIHVERERGKGDGKFELVVFKGLRKLILSGLPKFSSFCAKENEARGGQGATSGIAFLDGRQVSFPSLDSLTLCELPNLRKISEDKFPVVLQSLRVLEVKSCENLSNVMERNLHLKSLEELTIESCEQIETIFNMEKTNQGEGFKSQDLEKLKKLKLVDLRSLKTIWPLKNKEGSLVHNLNQLEVSHCHKLTHLFSPWMIKSLQNISQISVDNCKEMKATFVEGNGSDDSRETIGFSSLAELRIFDMVCLTTFAMGSRTFSFPCLKKLEMRGCPKLSTFVSVRDRSSHVKKWITRAFRGISKPLPQNVRRNLPRAEQHDGEADHEPFFSMKVILPSLEKLLLSSLGCLTSIWHSTTLDDSFCKLASIQIEKCNSLQILVSLEHGPLDLKEMTSSGSQRQSADIMRNSSGKPGLRFPFLTNIKIDECHELRSLFPDAVARTLFELENLHISSCKKMVEVVSAQKEETMMFNKLCSLKLENLHELDSFGTGSTKYYFPFLQGLWISGCTKLKSFIMGPRNSSTDTNAESTPLFDDKVIIPNLEKLHIEGLEMEDLLQDDFAPDLFSKLKDLEVEACHKLSTVIPPHILPKMQSLETLMVKHCNSVRVIVEFKGHILIDRKLSSSKSWKLKTIILDDLPQLEHIYWTETLSEYIPFNDLDILEVRSCMLLRNIFTVSTAKILEKLHKLIIEGCVSMKQVVDFEYGQDCSKGGTNKIILRQLSFLKLSRLPMLSSFCGKHMTEWPSLARMEVGDCNTVEAFAVDSEQHFGAIFLLEKVTFPKMKSLQIFNMLKMKELWSINGQGIDSECSSGAFFELKSFEIRNCPSLKTIFQSKMLTGFPNLETLTVDDCVSLEQVFEVQDLRSGAELNNTNSSIIIPFSLMELYISKLPAMNHVWDIENSKGINFACKRLGQITVQNCACLKHLFPASVARYLDQFHFIQIMDCKDMEEIVQKKVCGTDDDGEHHQFVPNLKVTSLKLIDLPELKSFIPCKNTTIIGCPKAKVPVPSLQEMSGDRDIIPVGKVDIPSSLKELKMDMRGLQEMLLLGGSANLSSLSLCNIDAAAVKGFPWEFLLVHFPNLERLEFSDSFIEELFPLANEEAQEAEEAIVPYNSKQENIQFQSLKKLLLRNLLGLKGVWREASVMEEVLNTVQYLDIVRCHSLGHLFQAPASFRNLVSIQVMRCFGMAYLLTSSAARCLKQLSDLKVSGCKFMIEIVKDDQDGNGGVNDICFPKLKEVILWGSKQLKSFCSSENCSFEFHCLESVILGDVPKLEAFCRGGFSAELLSEIGTYGEAPKVDKLMQEIEGEMLLATSRGRL